MIQVDSWDIAEGFQSMGMILFTISHPFLYFGKHVNLLLISTNKPIKLSFLFHMVYIFCPVNVVPIFSFFYKRLDST